MKLCVEQVALPDDTDLACWYAEADLADAYAIILPDDAASDARLLTSFVLGTPLPGSRAVMALRDALVQPLGIEASTAMGRTGVNDAPVAGIFPILRSTARETILGYDDRHLDFRISLLVRRRHGRQELVWTSVVRCHGLLGHAYLAAVRPFHRLAITLSLSAAALRGWPRDTAAPGRRATRRSRTSIS